MAGTTAFVWVLLGACGVAIVTVLARARVDIARIQSKTGDRAPARRG
ncbi:MULTISPECIES: hypothetical protein [unclassified Streptomyces]|nr:MULTISPECIES: hypothetical protein [unclassified Streptomyces]MCX4550559.1 hypothetical protein [Streptomyces sp. NBC_01500]WSC22006.1 hypothetical protein OIE60_21260 [Streptomyces sp. NBC_01766]